LDSGFYFSRDVSHRRGRVYELVWSLSIVASGQQRLNLAVAGVCDRRGAIKSNQSAVTDRRYNSDFLKSGHCRAAAGMTGENILKGI
jgi:hypothetical protein